MGVDMGNVAVKKVIHFGGAMMMVTILLCYALAVWEGYVEAWLPTISACGALPIEKYFFRYGLLSGAMILVVLALYIYTADFPFSKDRANVILGVTAGLALGVIAICSYLEDRPVHNFFSYTFFILEDLLMIHITLRCRRLHCRSTDCLSTLPISITVKYACTIIGCLSIGARLLVAVHIIPEIIHIGSDSKIPVLPIVEWSNVLIIIAYHWSFAFDFSPDYFIAAWKSTSTTAGAGREKNGVEVYKNGGQILVSVNNY